MGTILLNSESQLLSCFSKWSHCIAVAARAKLVSIFNFLLVAANSTLSRWATSSHCPLQKSELVGQLAFALCLIFPRKVEHGLSFSLLIVSKWRWKVSCLVGPAAKGRWGERGLTHFCCCKVWDRSLVPALDSHQGIESGIPIHPHSLTPSLHSLKFMLCE